MEINKRLISWIGSAIISIILTNLGLRVLSENAVIGIITAITGFVLLYFAYYTLEIRDYIEKSKQVDKWIKEKEQFLNTIKDIVILKKISKIKSK